MVPQCKNTSVTAPHKVFISLPKDSGLREVWYKAMRRTNYLSDKTMAFCCEEHFNLEEDMENYMYFKMMKNVVKVPIKLKPGTVPSIFNCQKYKKIPKRQGEITLVEKRLQKYILHVLDSEHTTRPSSDDWLIIGKLNHIHDRYNKHLFNTNLSKQM